MERRRPVIAFLVRSPFEILDLTGSVSVFERATAKGERYRAVVSIGELRVCKTSCRNHG